MGIERIKLKFEESKDTKEIIGFVSRSSTTWRLRGVSEKDDCPKKICLLAPDLKGLIKPNVVYEVELRPMRTGHGFIVISATRPKYDANIETIVIPKSVYQVRVIFGHKIIYFDPLGGNSPASRTIDGAEKALRGRDDLLDPEAVIEKFREAADRLLERMELDGYIVRR
ncbi:hypothetical protein A3BBH6_06940 [Alistipes onderdonkii subsp. vulgaris]|uniref:hypothetical protein n=1 Tax=Alistipes onderdonkii TaxID=328813 RepID=UPI0011444C11|nr:hypothetical protein [Alistipes onderdonkii]BBL00458.1 hypothetical protein A3BBH6_06940 [Alistipes onderdonkii subsp. vulgaris]